MNSFFFKISGIWGTLSDVEKKELYDKIGYKEEEDTKRLPKDVSSYHASFLHCNIIHLLTGYEGNSTFIVLKIPTIFEAMQEVVLLY